MRRMLTEKTLEKMLVDVTDTWSRLKDNPYKPPKERTIETITFCMIRNLSRHTIGIGTIRMKKSVTTLLAAFPM